MRAEETKQDERLENMANFFSGALTLLQEGEFSLKSRCFSLQTKRPLTVQVTSLEIKKPRGDVG